SFNLEEGKTLGLVGESGSGKSILCKSILRLLPRTAVVSKDSCIQFNGYENLERLSQKELNKLRGRKIAMIFQDPISSLNPVMKIGKQIAEPFLHHMGLNRKQARKKVIDLMKSVGIPMSEQRFYQYPHQLSGGICQRVAIAIALSCNPKLLIADEPTTALDVTVQAEILNLLGSRQFKKKMSMILVTHDLGVVAGRATEIAVMYAGKIVEQAPTIDLFTNMRMPYTRALMESIPNLDSPPHTTLTTIDGNPPDLLNPTRGCSFAPRCSHVQKRCLKAEPLLRSDSKKNHLFACWYPLGEQR
ncbi:ABC transporter ATP-binding protein, partial [Desulfobacterales bacterium HSG17]|nr:ABC transporter ATP-binding protein [Desulfobacterales bacterium HSG17]